MALTLNDNWVAAMGGSGIRFRHLVTITDGTNTFKSTDGICDQMDYPEAVTNVSSISAEMDPFSRTTTLGNTYVAFDDAYIRNIIASRTVPLRLKGQKVTIEIGEASLAEADFEPLFVGVIESIDARPDRTGVVLDCLDLFAVLRREEIVGSWIGRTPLEVIEDIIENKNAMPSGSWDTASLDPTDSANADISHFQVQRASAGLLDRNGGGSQFGKGLDSPVDSWVVVQSLCSLMDSQLIVTEDGVLTLKRFDPSAASVATWTDDDIIDLRQKPTEDNLTNKVVFNWLESLEIGQVVNTGEVLVDVAPIKMAQRYEVEDSTSQSDHALPGMASRTITRDISSRWLDWSWCLLAADMDASQTSITLAMPGPNVGGMCGMRHFIDAINLTGSANFEWDSVPTFAPQVATDQPSAARPCYLRIDDGDNVEIVQVVSAYTPTSGDYQSGVILVPGDPPRVAGLEVGYFAYYEVTATVVRAQLGTTGVAHDGTLSRTPQGRPIADWGAIRVVDITIPKFVADRKIERYSNAAPEATVTLPIKNYGPQLGDLTRVTWDNFLGYDLDGVDSSDGKWEVVRKQINAYDDEPTVEYDLVFSEGQAGTLVYSAPAYRPGPQFDRDAVRTGAIARGYVETGLVATAGTGLQVDVTEGRASNDASSMKLGAFSVNLRANKDTWVIMNTATGGMRAPDATIGTAIPDLAPSEVVISRVTTDGTGVTATDNTIQRAKPLNGEQIEQATVGFTQQITTSESYGGLSVIPNGDFGVSSYGADRPPDGWEFS